MEFLSVDNVCGQNLLRIAARGSAIIAELLRLADNIPEIFQRAEKSSDPEQRKYAGIMFDFHYLRDPEQFERRINANVDLLDLDQEFQEMHSELLDRFYRLFESIWRYQSDLAKFIDDVKNGYYIQHSIENMLREVEGRQLLSEAIYLYGMTLLLLEEKIPGIVRERMLVAMYRYYGEGTLINIDEVCKLCRSTGYYPGPKGKKPKNHPETLFARFAPDAEFIRLLIGRLLTDDVYLMSNSFPNPDHRSTRLAQQASILYVVLFFSPDLLVNQNAIMREIVDKYFNNNWVISTYMGQLVDLTVEWAPYPAARIALENVLSTTFVRQLTDANALSIQTTLRELSFYLKEGILQQDYVLDNMNELLNCVRKNNVALRWQLLHRHCRNDTFRKIVEEAVTPKMLVDMLLEVSQLEFTLKGIFQDLLKDKDTAWTDGKEAAAARMTELSEYFTGDKALSRTKKDDNMMRWFAGLSSQISGLTIDEEHATSTGRKIQGIIAALEDVEQYESVDTNLQMKSFLGEARDILKQMVRTVNIKQEILNIIDNVADLTYAWQALMDYLEVFHERIRNDPSSVVLLRAFFLKAASILDVPLVRITAIDSPDAVSVAEYYSSELVRFVRLVLEIIPKSVFNILSEIEQIQTHKMPVIPIRIEARSLRDYAQLDLLFELSKLTHQVSVFTEGVLVMEKTLLGVIQVDPRQILQEGLMRELVRLIAHAMHDTLTFPVMDTYTITTALSKLAATLVGLKRSIEYLQDYIDFAGLKMFQEELSRVVNYNTEQEANRYVKKKIFDNASRYQNRAIPIPRLLSSSSSSSSSSGLEPSSSSSYAYSSDSTTTNDASGRPIIEKGLDDSATVNFMGRLMNALLHLTDPARTVYAPECSAWFRYVAPDTSKNGGGSSGGGAAVKTVAHSDTSELCGIRFFALLEKAIGAIGLRGLDRLLAFRTVYEFNSFVKFYESDIQGGKFRNVLEQVRESLTPEHRSLAGGTKIYAAALQKVEPLMPPLLAFIRRIGQGQLIRRQIAYALQFGCQLDAHVLYQALDTFNESLLNDVKEHYRQPEKHPYPAKNNPLLVETTALLEACGLDDPLHKIYMTTKPMEGLAVILLLLLLTYLPKMEYDINFGSLVRRKDSYPLDGMPIAAGLACLLKQVHPAATRQLIAYLGQFVRTSVQQVFGESDQEANQERTIVMPREVLNVLIFLDQLCKFSSVPRTVVHAFVPPYIFDSIRYNSNVNGSTSAK